MGVLQGVYLFTCDQPNIVDKHLSDLWHILYIKCYFHRQ